MTFIVLIIMKLWSGEDVYVSVIRYVHVSVIVCVY